MLLLLAVLLVLGQTVLLSGGASAEDPAELTIDKQVLGWTDGHEVVAGETFTYTLTITCSNIGSGGCTSARLTDQLPPWLTVDGPVTVTGAAGTPSVAGSAVTISFTDPLTDPVGGSGLLDQSTATVTIPVRVADDIPASVDGQNLVNTASVAASNAATATDTFTVVPDVPVVLEATAD